MTDTVKLIWATPDAEKLLMYMARVSNPANQDSDNVKLIKYLIQHKHWSPFEMVNACIEINTTRDIGRQILRHRSFSYQEFSQRYAKPSELEWSDLRELRLQDTKNRQNSISVDNPELEIWWYNKQKDLRDKALDIYREALERGLAKEQARCVLPEGLTMSRMYMSGSLRSWIHYIKVRTDPSTQKEHRLIAQKIKEILNEVFPFTLKAIDEVS